MLYIVQAVSAGTAEIPKLFVDAAKAAAAYVALAKETWGERYFAYCEQHGVDRDGLVSAQAFAATLDWPEKGRINYWCVEPADLGLDSRHLLSLGLEAMHERRERILHLTGAVEQRALAVKDGLSGLLDSIAALADDLKEIGALPAAGQTGGGPEGAARPALPTLRQAAPPAADERYHTPEWKAFVGAIINLCGGSRSEYPLLTRQDWRQEVYSNATAFEYWQWVAAKINGYQEKAGHAGYAVVADAASPGHYRFKTPEGLVSGSSCCAEWEAWCQAGLHLEGSSSSQ